MKWFFAYALAFIVFSAAGMGLAETSDQPASEASAELIRVGGNYLVHEISQNPSGTFRIEFRSEQPDGKYGTIILNSDHVHVAVTKGQKLRISAEIGRVTNGVAEATQVLVFIPNIRGPMPVWLLSSSSKNLHLRGARYLEMHAPLSDYNVL